MKNVSEKWQLLAKTLRKQQREPHLRNFRDLLTTGHLVEKYVDIMEDTKGTVSYNSTEKLIMYLILLKCDYMTPTEISKIALRPIDTINKSIDGLSKKGIIKSSQSKTDRRIRKVILSDKGLESIEKILPVRALVFHQAMETFSNDEAKLFTAFLKRLREQMVQVIHSHGQKSNKTFTSSSINDPFDNFSSSKTHDV
jgi:DNA-binding MarR family transcriptional regulator